MQAKINYKRAFPDWNMTNSLLVMEKVSSSGAKGTPIPIDKKAAEDDIALALKPVAEKYGDDVNLLYNTTNWPANSQKVCDMLLMLYQQEAALSDNRCANLLRNNLLGEQACYHNPNKVNAVFCDGHVESPTLQFLCNHQRRGLGALEPRPSAAPR